MKGTNVLIRMQVSVPRVLGLCGNVAFALDV